MTHKAVLLTGLTGAQLERFVAIYSRHSEVVIVRDRAALEAVEIDRETSLISFGTGIIVSRELLSRLERPAYNLHAASPDFPGRDPHHHAIYQRAGEYGATLHIMEEKVDSGPIVAVERFPVPEQATARELLATANAAGLSIFERIGLRLLDPLPLPALADVTWGGVKTSRADLRRLCDVSPLISEDEFELRCRAFDNESYANLTTKLHGQLFRIDKQAQALQPVATGWEEFTEEGFRALLRRLTGRGYKFSFFGEHPQCPHVLWRHDVDFSVHRAAQLAAIEADEGVVATYFLNPRCIYYSIFEPAVEGLIRKILAAGHRIGLHFDTSQFQERVISTEMLTEAVERDCQLLEFIVERPIEAVSWHNPGLSTLLSFDESEIAGRVNAYSAFLRAHYIYASDSNGYWRFAPMAHIIDAAHPRLHLLTHPELWTPQPMSPSERIDRCILGRARAARLDHEMKMAVEGRHNPAGTRPRPAST
jgi:hypothetical protein